MMKIKNTVIISISPNHPSLAVLDHWASCKGFPAVALVRLYNVICYTFILKYIPNAVKTKAIARIATNAEVHSGGMSK